MAIPGLTPAAWEQLRAIYGIPPEAHVLALSTDANRIYQISAPGRDKQVVRLYGSGATSAIRARLEVLKYLSQVPGLRAPTPVAGTHSQFLSTICEKELPKPTLVAMLSWVAGEKIPNIPSRELTYQIGQALGQLDASLRNADALINPCPSQSRGPFDVKAIVDWSLSQLSQHHAGVDFLHHDSQPKQLHPTIFTIAERLRRDYRRVRMLLPHQLIHTDAHFDNLVFDGTRIGFLDFDNMALGPRIYELAPPIHSIYELEMSACMRRCSGSLDALKEALVSGYCSCNTLSALELNSLPLLQAMHQFLVLGWYVQRNDLRGQSWLAQYGRTSVQRILALLDQYEDNMAGLSNLSRWMGLADIKLLLAFNAPLIVKRTKKFVELFTRRLHLYGN